MRDNTGIESTAWQCHNMGTSGKSLQCKQGHGMTIPPGVFINPDKSLKTSVDLTFSAARLDQNTTYQ